MQQAIKPKACSAWFGHVDLPQEIRLRRLKQGDCLDQLTGMLHRAYSRLGEMGIPCSCVNQAPEVTRQRVASGECFVAVSGERVVGTISLYASDAASDSRHYRDARVASARQLGVDPHFQGKGVGTALLRLAGHWARRHGCARLALDTPEQAGHLIDYYHRLGFRVVETLQFSSRPYLSVVLDRSLFHDAATYRRRVCPLRRRRALAAVPTPHVEPQTDTMRRATAIPHACGVYRSHWMVSRVSPPRKGR